VSATPSLSHRVAIVGLYRGQLMFVRPTAPFSTLHPIPTPVGHPTTDISLSRSWVGIKADHTYLIT